MGVVFKDRRGLVEALRKVVPQRDAAQVEQDLRRAVRFVIPVPIRNEQEFWRGMRITSMVS